MLVKEIIQAIEKIAPLSYQEDYDNAGLIIGNADAEIHGILLCLDTTEDVIQEAIDKKCNLIVAHHPIIFKGLKKLNGKNYVERTVIKAIQNNLNIYVAHTNLDNVLHQGVSQRMALKMGLENLKILAPKSQLLNKINVYAPIHHVEPVKAAMFAAGGGVIGNYSECSFDIQGTGSFKGNEFSNPQLGEKNKRESVEEIKIEMIVPSYLNDKIITAARMAHFYEEMPFEIIPLQNQNQEVGSGMIGEFKEAMPVELFLDLLKTNFNLQVIKHTAYNQAIKKVAVCGGSGSFLTKVAMSQKADAYVTSDIKYHEFFDSENQMLLCDIGHYESEISTLDIFYEIIQEKKPNFAVIFCNTNTNPVKYYK
jgi:dinuclear metal center YbgI/SA1388 family protein